MDDLTAGLFDKNSVSNLVKQIDKNRKYNSKEQSADPSQFQDLLNQLQQGNG